jgi:hypothetical protein
MTMITTRMTPMTTVTPAPDKETIEETEANSFDRLLSPDEDSKEGRTSLGLADERGLHSSRFNHPLKLPYVASQLLVLGHPLRDPLDSLGYGRFTDTEVTFHYKNRRADL